jgi:lipopolysaccharide/colanic/teichoic acid biosynthesis glycosyltransferase
MSLAVPKLSVANPLADIVEEYGSARDLPATGWLTHLELDAPRENLRSLDWPTRCVKRLTDLVVSVLLLVLLAPVMLVVALSVWWTSPGPIIFSQVRTGLNSRWSRKDRRRASRSVENERRSGRDRRHERSYGRPFVLYKFRTMRTDAEKHGAQFATKGDPRVTPIGRFLRKTRLDELPQLWNVLRGEMTLVGPRPERPEFIEQLSTHVPGYLDRLGLTPGLTGLAQVENGYDNDLDGFRRKVALDLLYLQNCCFWNDVKILVRTVGVVLTGKGAL